MASEHRRWAGQDCLVQLRDITRGKLPNRCTPLL